MKPSDWLGATRLCECGRTHAVATKEIVYAADAVRKTARFIGKAVKGRRALIVCDCRTRALGAEELCEVLHKARWSVSTIALEDPPSGSPVCDDETMRWLLDRAPVADVYVAVGSGVVNDLTKWCAHERGLPYVVVATAASMNGYSAANVAPMVKGVKLLVRAAEPLAVFAVPSVIEHAPGEMTAAGFGDVIAKPMSTADWLMNHMLLGEHYCPVCAGMISEIEPLYLARPDAIAAHEPGSMRALFDALVYSGVAMTMMGTSAPASGGEHLFSHTLDMMSSVDDAPHDLHGRQVALGTIFAAALYERLFAIDAPDVHTMPVTIDKKFWGPIAPAIAAEYAAKQQDLQRLAERLSDRDVWHAMRHAVTPRLRSPEAIADSLVRAGAARWIDDIGCTKARARAALRHMHEIRKRTTVIDVAWLAGLMPGVIDEIFDDWLVR